MEKAGTNDGADMVFHGELAVQVHSKIANHIDRLDDVWSDVEIEIEIGDFLQICPGSETRSAQSLSDSAEAFLNCTRPGWLRCSSGAS